MIGELLKPVLVIVVAFLLRLALTYLGVELDVEVFNTIVAAIVSVLIGLIVQDEIRLRARGRVRRLFHT